MTNKEVKEAIADWLEDLSSKVDTTELRVRFFDKTSYPDDSDDCCLLWTSSKTGKYGRFTIKGVPLYAHRVAVRLGDSDTPPRAVPRMMTVDHRRRCSKLCVRPSHLTVKTRSSNSRATRDLSVFT
jgi:hypothetical protein